jgi:hypothetical protein
MQYENARNIPRVFVFSLGETSACERWISIRRAELAHSFQPNHFPRFR